MRLDGTSNQMSQPATKVIASFIQDQFADSNVNLSNASFSHWIPQMTREDCNWQVLMLRKTDTSKQPSQSQFQPWKSTSARAASQRNSFRFISTTTDFHPTWIPITHHEDPCKLLKRTLKKANLRQSTLLHHSLQMVRLDSNTNSMVLKIPSRIHQSMSRLPKFLKMVSLSSRKWATGLP